MTLEEAKLAIMRSELAMTEIQGRLIVSKSFGLRLFDEIYEIAKIVGAEEEKWN